MKWFIILLVMIEPSFFMGNPVAFKNICWVYPPKIKDVVGNIDYGIYKKILLTSQEEIEDIFAEGKLPFDNLPTPLEYIFLLSDTSSEIKDFCLKAFEFFLHEPVLLLSDIQQIVVGNLQEQLDIIKTTDQLRIINNDNFFDLQNLIRNSIGMKSIEPYNPNENPKIKYFKAKARLRDKVKAQSGDALNLGSTLAAICCMNFGINPLNIGELSQAAVTVLIRYYQEKSKYDSDMSFLLAGADSKKIQPQYWIRNIEDL